MTTDIKLDDDDITIEGTLHMDDIFIGGDAELSGNLIVVAPSPPPVFKGPAGSTDTIDPSKLLATGKRVDLIDLLHVLLRHTYKLEQQVNSLADEVAVLASKVK